MMAEYEYYGLFAGIVQPIKSRLYVLTHVNGLWTVKHRITFPIAVRMIAGRKPG